MSWFMGDSKARNEEVDGLMRSLESVALERDDALRLISHWTKVPV